LAMVQATKFLLRWIYLNNLIRDQASIQELPQIQHSPTHQQQHQYPPHNQHFPDDTTPSLDSYQRRSHHDSPTSSFQQQAQPFRTSNPRVLPNYPKQSPIDPEEEWKQKALHAIALYPSGSPRLLALDSLRLEVVHKFASELHEADLVIQEYFGSLTSLENPIGRNERVGISVFGDKTDMERKHSIEDKETIHKGGFNHEDPYLDADLEIMKTFEEATACDILKSLEDHVSSDEGTQYGEKNDVGGNTLNMGESENEEKAFLVISPRHRNDVLSDSIKDHNLSGEDVNAKIRETNLHDALSLQKETREYLPQLVSAILHSPPPLTQSTMVTTNLNPLATLHRLLITRCLKDPNLGIELCWLLEAEVGRAWKSIFEHRQRTGRRLIIFLQADKAAVIAKIGIEKRSAFDLLQDVESATAYGMTEDNDRNPLDGASGEGEWMLEHDSRHDKGDGISRSELFSSSRLPSSLSLRRCSHFGDTMHFIDRLTQISLDLKQLPTLQRKSFLQDSLSELNRRLRRRMITKGDVSLDVEDNHGPYDWPTLNEITQEMVAYSVHLPLEPKTSAWLGSCDTELAQSTHPFRSNTVEEKHSIMRILNIVSPKCRVLASRDRCPFLICCEIAETGLYAGSDARLYASSGTRDIGTTLDEVMGMAARERKHLPASNTSNNLLDSFTSYHIPSEIFINDKRNEADDEGKLNVKKVQGIDNTSNDLSSASDTFLRGGYQETDYAFQASSNGASNMPSAFDFVRDEQLKQLHEQLRSQQYQSQFNQQQESIRASDSDSRSQELTTSSALLDRVFGLPWNEECEQIKMTSPFRRVKGWRLATFIMKAGEDIRREALVMQVITKMNGWFQTDIPDCNRPYLKPYSIMCVGGDAGMLECVQDAKSLDEVKKETDGFTSLRDYFQRAYPSSSKHPTATYNKRAQSKPVSDQLLHSTSAPISFETAQDNFLRSLVGYSLVCYILQIKDRHNANILLDRYGHLMHIDFGFVLGDTPKMGKVPIFSERAPFKLNSEFWDVIGGWNFNKGGLGVRFCKMFEEAFFCASSHSDEIVTLIEAGILNLTRNPKEARSLATGVLSRLKMRGHRDSVEQKTFIMDLVNTALTSWGTSTYDWLQKNMNGYI